MATISLFRPRATRLDEAHSAHVNDSIARHWASASRALQNAEAARRRGDESRARGLTDEAATYRAMADGLVEQRREINQEGKKS